MSGFPKSVIFFGAGASRGAGIFMPETPPLGRELFGELRRHFCRSWGNLPNSLADEFEKEPLFERGMTILWNDYSQYVPELMQQMCLYFIQFRSKKPGETLYDRLLQKISEYQILDQVALSTINYECLIERAATSSGLAIEYFSMPLSKNAVSLWKLHGSCNFWPSGIRATRGVTFTRGVVFNTALLAHRDLNDSVTMCLADNALPPAMCLYMPGKPSQVSPASIAAIQELWAQSVCNAEKEQV